jgi:hypothetical protein
MLQVCRFAVDQNEIACSAEEGFKIMVQSKLAKTMLDQPGLTQRRVAPMRGDAGSSRVDSQSLRLAAILLFVGELLFVLAGLFHPDRENANHHSAAFTEYASNASWTLVHLGQFAGMAVILAGLLVLFFALNVRAGGPGWANRFGAVAALVTLALYAVLQAVDGVALKQAVDAWVNAPAAEKAARFASAEAIRWLEWAVRSYHSFLLGLSFLLFAIVIVWTARVPRLLGALMGLTGLAYLGQGFVLGAEGFSANNTLPTLLAYVLWLVWSLWLLIFAWQIKEPVKAANG